MSPQYPITSSPLDQRTAAERLALSAAGLEAGSPPALAEALTELADHGGLLEQVVKQVLQHCDEHPTDALMELDGHWAIARRIAGDTDAVVLLRACVEWRYWNMEEESGVGYDDVQISLPEWPTLIDLAPYVAAEVLANVAYRVARALSAHVETWTEAALGEEAARQVMNLLDEGWDHSLNLLLLSVAPDVPLSGTPDHPLGDDGADFGDGRDTIDDSDLVGHLLGFAADLGSSLSADYWHCDLLDAIRCRLDDAAEFFFAGPSPALSRTLCEAAVAAALLETRITSSEPEELDDSGDIRDLFATVSADGLSEARPTTSIAREARSLYDELSRVIEELDDWADVIVEGTLTLDLARLAGRAVRLCTAVQRDA